MPGPSWASPGQIDFLVSYKPAHTKAQEESTLLAFWTDIYREFFAQWPDRASEIWCAKDSLHADDKLAEGSKKERSKKKNKKKKDLDDESPALSQEEWVTVRREEIYNWYNNHGLNKGSRCSGKVQSVRVVLQPPTTRTPTEYHMYSKLYYESCVKVHVDNEIGDQNIDCSKWIATTINKHLIKKYNNESDNIKNEIRSAIEKERKAKEAKKEAFEAIANCSEELTAEQYTIVQAAAPDMIKDFLEMMSKRMGWSYIHSGVNIHGMTFAKFQPNYQKKFVVPYLSFLKTMKTKVHDKLLQLPESKIHVEKNSNAIIHSTIELGNELEETIKEASKASNSSLTTPSDVGTSADMKTTTTNTQKVSDVVKTPAKTPLKTACKDASALVTKTPSGSGLGTALSQPAATVPEPTLINPTATFGNSPVLANILQNAAMTSTVCCSPLGNTTSTSTMTPNPHKTSTVIPSNLANPASTSAMTPEKSALPEPLPNNGQSTTHGQHPRTEPKPLPVPDIPMQMSLDTSVFKLPSAFQSTDIWNFGDDNGTGTAGTDMSMSTQYHGSKLSENPYKYSANPMNDLMMMNHIFDPDITSGKRL